MDFQSNERAAAILGIVFAVWLIWLIYLMVNANWRVVAVAAVVGAAILLVARSLSRAS
jgi:uncharacterized membrane protein